MASSHVERAFEEELEHLGEMEHLTAAHIRRNVYLSAQTFDDATSSLPLMDEDVLRVIKDEGSRPLSQDEDAVAVAAPLGAEGDLDGESCLGEGRQIEPGDREIVEEATTIELGEADKGPDVDDFVEDMRALMQTCTTMLDDPPPRSPTLREAAVMIPRDDAKVMRSLAQKRNWRPAEGARSAQRRGYAVELCRRAP